MTSLVVKGDDAEIAIDDGLISHEPAKAGTPTLDCRGLVVSAGGVNAHTHLYSGLAPYGMPAPAHPPTNFVEILERVWWRLDRALDEDSLRASADLYIAEALLAGTTTLIDHHESPHFIHASLDILADSAQTLGCRLVTCYGATERNRGLDEARRGFAECARFARTNRRPLVRPMVGLHASFTLSDDALRAAADCCRDLELPTHVHVAEDGADVEDAKRRGYAGPIERLFLHVALPPGSIVAHGVHLTEAQVSLASDAGVWFVQNPRSNRGNAVGYPLALHASHRVALGTDGYPADMQAEAAALLRESADAGEPATAAVVAERIRCGGRIASERFELPFGRRDPGFAADLVARASSDSAAATHVVVAGDVVVRDGRLVHGDIDAIRARAKELAPALWTRMQAYPEGSPG